MFNTNLVVFCCWFEVKIIVHVVLTCTYPFHMMYNRTAKTLIITIWIIILFPIFHDFDTLFVIYAFRAHPWFGYPFSAFVFLAHLVQPPMAVTPFLAQPIRKRKFFFSIAQKFHNCYICTSQCVVQLNDITNLCHLISVYNSVYNLCTISCTFAYLIIWESNMISCRITYMYIWQKLLSNN